MGLSLTSTRRRLCGLLVALALTLGIALALGAAAPTAHAATASTSTSADASTSGIGTVAAALRRSPVYVDPRVSSQLPPSAAKALAKKIEDSGKPVFVAVLPAAPEFPPSSLLPDLRTEVGITGVYAVHLGARGFNAGADPQVMPHTAVLNLARAARDSYDSDTTALLNNFVDQATAQAAGHAPASWGDAGGSQASQGAGAGTAIAAGVLVLVLAGGGFALYRRARSRRRERERVRLESLRTVVDEDITAFGEELERLDFSPSGPASDDAMRRDYAHALDCYDRAKETMAAARRPGDVRQVTEALEEGRFALATLAARRTGAPLPERRVPCFFDPRHGPSVRDVPWAPPGGAVRSVPACTADATRLADGEPPMARTVRTARGPQPYWDAGPTYAPWAGGYFGGGVLPALLVGTVLGGVLSDMGHGGGFGFGGFDGFDGYGDAYDGGPGWDGGAFGDSVPQGGDYSGADFNPADFSGGFGDTGGFGGFDGGGGDGGFGGGFDGGNW